MIKTSKIPTQFSDDADPSIDWFDNTVLCRDSKFQGGPIFFRRMRYYTNMPT